MNTDQDLVAFEKVVDALEPWLGQVVIIGGWAHRLYLLQPIARDVDYEPLGTDDVDVAMPDNGPIVRDDLHSRLTSRGFDPDFLGTESPPVTHYELRDHTSPFYLEFLTPLRGADHDRKGNPKSTHTVAGVTTQRLRYLELLLEHPWEVEVGGGGFKRLVRIANPTSFIAQKLLIHEKRNAEERAKDIVYIHDTLEFLGSELPRLGAVWREILRDRLHARQIKRVEQSGAALFDDLSDDVRRAARVPADRSLSPERVREVCRFGLEEIFGPK